MKINTQNYEAYFIDFIEGNLKPDDELELRNFLRLHPDLEMEMENLCDFKITPEKMVYEHKYLLKEKDEIFGISKIERLSIEFLENEIKPIALKQLNKSIKSPEYNKVFEDLQKTKLSAESVFFNNKDALKRKTVTSSTSFIISRLVYLAAASVLLFISLTFWVNIKNNLKSKDISLYKIKNIPSRKISEPQHDSKLLSIIDNTMHTKYQEAAHTAKNKHTTLREKEKAIFIKAFTHRTIQFKAQRKVDLCFADINQNKAIVPIHIEEDKKPLKQKVLWTLKKAGKNLWYELSYSFRKNIYYKKLYLNDGKILIAFKAGDYEYKKIKTQQIP